MSDYGDGEDVRDVFMSRAALTTMKGDLAENRRRARARAAAKGKQPAKKPTKKQIKRGHKIQEHGRTYYLFKRKMKRSDNERAKLPRKDKIDMNIMASGLRAATRADHIRKKFSKLMPQVYNESTARYAKKSPKTILSRNPQKANAYMKKRRQQIEKVSKKAYGR